MAFVQEDCNPSMIEIGFNGIITASESGYDTLDIGCSRDIASQDIELVILFRYVSFKAMCTST